MTIIDAGSTLATAKRQNGALFPLEIAFADYDRTRPLIDGRAKAAGIVLSAKTSHIGDFCRRPVYEEYDGAEMSFSLYVMARDRGEPVIALPVFLLRMPILGYIYVRSDSPITKPSQLIGKRIGARGYRQTVNLWMRGLLSEHYGLAHQDATWVTAGPEDSGYVPPKDAKIEIQDGASALDNLKRGAVDAIVTTSVPKPLIQGEPWIRRLFPDAQAESHALAQRTGFSPITHVFVMKKSLVDREPWLAASLFNAFVEAQRVADESCQFDSKRLSLIDASFIFEQQRAYGAFPYSHGLKTNRANVETFARYAHEQNYTSRRLSVEELFAPATLTL